MNQEMIKALESIKKGVVSIYKIKGLDLPK